MALIGPAEAGPAETEGTEDEGTEDEGAETGRTEPAGSGLAGPDGWLVTMFPLCAPVLSG
jgi:hypothetical protein